MEAAFPLAALERKQYLTAAVQVAEPLRIFAVLEVGPEVIVQFEEPFQGLLVACELVSFNHADGAFQMHPPQLLVPFQFLGRIALAVHEIEDAAVLLVPAIVYHAEGNVHALVDNILPMQPDTQVHHEPQGFQVVPGIHAAAFEAVYQRAVRSQVFHHHAQVRLVKYIEYLMQRLLDGFVQQGFVLDDERLKQGSHFGKDYFDDLLERIREIRASERRYYQKITDIYAECSADYDPKSEATLLFFKIVQNIMHWAVTHQTAAEIIYSRADAGQPHMGLTTWKKAPEGRVQRSDTIVAKNYLSDKEITALNRLSTAFLDLAETQAERHIVMNMADWQLQLEKLLSAYNYDILQNAGTVSAEDAKQKAFAEYDKFKLIQDRDYLSDFDKLMEVSAKYKA